MKKKLSFLSIILASFLVLCSCTSNSTIATLSSNWYNDTTKTKVTSDVYEKCTYAVSYDNSTATNTALAVESLTGTYTTTLSSVYFDNKNDYCYKYETALSINVKYSNSEEAYNDTITTSCTFANVESYLYPIESERNVYNHSANSTATVKLLNYKVNTTYAEGNARVVMTNNEDGSTKETLLENITKAGYFTFDNEELLFAMRGFNLEGENFQLNMSVIDGASGKLQTNYLSGGQFADMTYSNINWNNTETFTEKVIPTNVATLKLNSKMAGTVKKFYYAKKFSSDINTYRNVLLKVENPMSYNLGTINYSLIEVLFNR